MKVFLILETMSKTDRDCIGCFSSLENALKCLIDFNCKPLMGKLDHISILPSPSSDNAYKVFFFFNKGKKKVCFTYEIYEQELDKIPED